MYHIHVFINRGDDILFIVPKEFYHWDTVLIIARQLIGKKTGWIVIRKDDETVYDSAISPLTYN